MSDTLSKLEERLSNLEAVIEIIRLEAEYARSWDIGQGRRWAQVFTSDGSFELLSWPGRPGRRVTGSDALEAFCHEINTHTTGVHLMHLPHVSVDGDTAKGSLYFEFKKTVTVTGEAGPGSTTGFYEVTYVRTPRGWRIKERMEKGIFRTSHTFGGV